VNESRHGGKQNLKNGTVPRPRVHIDVQIGAARQ
jgi:hypothetical protein